MKWCRFQIGHHISQGIVEDDIIEVEISHIGTLRNYVVAEA